MKRRSTQPPRRYERRGYLALEPKAFLDFFMIPETRDNEELGDVTVVDICGPLETHDDGWCDSYEAIRRRITLACESSAKAIVMRFDSPGGDVAGCFETARAIRRACANAGKPLYAYIEKANSAAYALASAAQQIVLSDTGIAGSIGVISTREDYSAMNASRGVRFAFVASGSHKTDGHPDAPISESEIKATQRIVDSLAGVFFALVAEQRGMTVEAVEALDANVFHGEAAIRAGLADGISTFEALVALATEGKAMATPYETAREALEEAAKGDDANAAAAKRALAAMNAEDDDDDDDDDDKKKDDDDDKASSGGGEASASSDDDDDKASSDGGEASAESEPDDSTKPRKPKSSAKSADPGLQALAELHELKASLAKDKIKAERQALIDSRADFSPELKAALSKAPIETVRNMVKTLPKGEVTKRATTKHTAAASSAAGTRGVSQGDEPVADSELDELDRRMGVSGTRLGCERKGSALVFGVVKKNTAAVSGTKEVAK